MTTSVCLSSGLCITMLPLAWTLTHFCRLTVMLYCNDSLIWFCVMMAHDRQNLFLMKGYECHIYCLKNVDKASSCFVVCADDPDQNPNPLQHLHAAGYGSFPGSFPGVPQPQLQQQQQHSMQQPPQQPQPQAQHSADPVIDPTRAGRAPSGPIGASLESRGSSSSNLATQVCHTLPIPVGHSCLKASFSWLMAFHIVWC